MNLVRPRLWRIGLVPPGVLDGCVAYTDRSGRWVRLRGRVWWRTWRRPRALPCSAVLRWLLMRAARAFGRLQSRLGAGAAARAMVVLNREARAKHERRYEIYELKNRLVRVFHERVPTWVGVDHQVLTCWECYGDAAACWKCGGTGVFARHRLYRFTFRIGRRRYTWHQPERLVDWPVEVEGDAGVYQAESGPLQGIRPASPLGLVRRMALVEAYLERAGVRFWRELTPAPQPPGFSAAVRVDLEDLAEAARRWLRREIEPDVEFDSDLPF